MCFCHILHTVRERDSFRAAFQLESPLASLLCMPQSLTQVKREAKEASQSKYPSIYKLVLGA